MGIIKSASAGTMELLRAQMALQGDEQNEDEKLEEGEEDLEDEIAEEGDEVVPKEEEEEEIM